ncbi:TPA: phage tail protein [Escherichia coli]|nr:phage tail protein [Escherichia coli]EHS1279508.1 phage tail protein [Escherichia coli]EIT7659775.1 phage tail protein [Escherichia coli]EIY9332341.1 phage tail protein [Escherichia coli]EIZ3480383.1 phage tail protein [Escherichia coli]EIZ6833577.1 phage tail protein [Escherichia coli]
MNISAGQVVAVIEDGAQQQSSNARGAADARIMMMLGDFSFSVDTAAYNQLTREASWNWSEQERIGRQSLLQYTGKPGRTVRIEGESHAFFGKTGTDAVNTLYDIADMAEPQLLVSGEGDVLGWWVVQDFSDSTDRFLPGGGHRNKHWSMTLKHYADNLSDP